MNNNNNKCVVYLSETGYKVSSVFGKILYDGKSFKHLRDAIDFCNDEEIDYFVA